MQIFELDRPLHLTINYLKLKRIKFFLLHELEAAFNLVNASFIINWSRESEESVIDIVCFDGGAFNSHFSLTTLLIHLFQQFHQSFGDIKTAELLFRIDALLHQSEQLVVICRDPRGRRVEEAVRHHRPRSSATQQQLEQKQLVWQEWKARDSLGTRRKRCGR
jgi:hypothetical protein